MLLKLLLFFRIIMMMILLLKFHGLSFLLFVTPHFEEMYELR